MRLSSIKKQSAVGLAILICGSGFVPAVGQGRGHESRHSTPAWRTQTGYPLGAGNLDSVSCPTATLCVAVGATDTNGTIVRSTTGGAHWWNTNVPESADNGTLPGVACPSATECIATINTFAGGGTPGQFLVSNDGGQAWRTVTGPPKQYGLGGIACPTTRLCYATSAAGGPHGSIVPGIVVSNDGGASWYNQPVAGANELIGSNLQGIACASVSTCIALGTTNGGSTLVYRTADGHQWSRVGFPTGVQASAVACPSADVCEVIGRQGSKLYAGRSLNAGITWQSQALPPGRLFSNNAIACSSVAVCEVVGSSGSHPGWAFRTDDGGSSWTSEALPASDSDMQSIACESVTRCVATGAPYISPGDTNPTAGAKSAMTTDSGVEWTVAGNFEGTALGTVACADSEDCLATADGGSTTGHEALATTDGGRTWAITPMEVSVRSLSCPSVTFCVGVSSIGLIYTDDLANQWHLGKAPDGSGMSLVSCPTASVCFAIGYGPSPGYAAVVDRTTDGGAVWSEMSFPDSKSGAAGLACPSSEVCVVSEGLGATVYRTTDGGVTWSASHVEPIDGGPVTCPSTTFCYMVRTTIDDESSVLKTVNGGATWTSVLPASIDGQLSWSEVACISTNVCQLDGTNLSPSGALQAAASVTTDGGGRWTSEGIPAGLESMYDLSCTTEGTCEAIGYSGRSWVLLGYGG